MIIWVWGPGEESLVRQGQELATVPTLLAPPTSFRELAALLSKCDLFVGNSNGPSHVAVAMDVKSVQLHGHTRATSWCPPRPEHRYCQSTEFNRTTNPTLDSISVEDVLAEIKQLLPVS